MRIKVNVAQLPKPPYPPTRSVRIIEKPDTPFEIMDFDEESMAGRRKRALESRAKNQENGYTAEQEALIMALYKQGMPTEAIADKLGRTKTAIKQKIEKLRKKYNFNREAPLQRQYIKRKPESEIVRRNHYTPAQDAVITEMKMQGKTFREIGDEIDKSAEAVRRRWYRIQGLCGR